LRDRLRAVRGPLSPQEGLSYLRQAAEAIDFAHSKQLLHRDIKPSNMLLSNGWLSLSDFGIAKLLTSNTYRSHTRKGAGTPEYMAPEQAMGKAQAASDLYSLAVIAFQMFAGRLPFEGEAAYELLLKQVTAEPPGPRQFNPQVPEGVEAVILKALSKQPQSRYRSCQEFVDALELAGRGVSASPDDDPEATDPGPKGRRARRKELSTQPTQQLASLPPALTPELAPQTLIMAPAPLVSPSDSLVTEIPLREKSTDELQGNERAGRGKVRRRVLLAGGAVAAVAVVAGGAGLALRLLPAAKPAKTGPVPGPKQFMPGKALVIMREHTDNVNAVAWDPSGRYLASGGDDAHIMVWDVGGMLQKKADLAQTLDKPVHKWTFKYGISFDELHWARGGRGLIATDLDAETVVFLNATKDTDKPLPFTAPPTAVDGKPNFSKGAVSPRGDMLAAVDNRVHRYLSVGVWRWDKPTEPAFYLTYTDPKQVTGDSVVLYTLGWSANGSMLAGYISDGNIGVWDMATKKFKAAIALQDRTGGKNIVVPRITFTWSPVDQNVLAVANEDAIAIIDVEQKKVLYQLTTDNPAPFQKPKGADATWGPSVIGLAWAPNGRYLAASYDSSAKIYVWDVKMKNAPTNQEGLRLQQQIFPQAGDPVMHGNVVLDLAWSPDGRYLASGSADKSIIVWLVDAS
ncbi:MAG: protein kinase, partial [Ktedonobacteraceae bacterium]|nr:protein kinase [Ktedonobacteraceae bacterium]